MISTRSRTVGVTGVGAISAMGRGCGPLWDGVAAGRDAIGVIDRFSTQGFSVHLGAIVPDEDRAALGETDEQRCVSYAVVAAREAWTSAAADSAKVRPERIALVVGTGLGSPGRGLHQHAEEVASTLGVAGPLLTVSTACCSSTNAIGLGRDLLVGGAADLVLAGGMDVLSPPLFAGFHSLGVLCPDKCAPFSEPVGMTLGEGAGFLVLERFEDARDRGVAIHALIRGYGLAGDAYDETSPDPSGAGVARGLAAALADAGLQPRDVGYVNLHGTGTAANDPAEWRAVQRVFGVGAEPAVSSTKSQIGHTQGAAGALETIVTILAMGEGVAPPTLRFSRPRNGGPDDPIAQDKPRPLAFRHALCTNSAFGGANAAVVVSAASSDRDELAAPLPLAPVWIEGAGAVAGHGLTLAELDAALERGRFSGGFVPGFEVREYARDVDPRGLDPLARYLIAASASALSDAQLRVRGAVRDRTGIVMGVSRLSASSEHAFWQSVEHQGLDGLSPAAFTRMVLNAPVGSCAMALSLRGPLSTLTTGPGSGLVALVYAADLLARRRDADWLIAGGLDEIQRSPEPQAQREGVPVGEGAACLVLGNHSSRTKTPGVRIAGWGLAGRGRLPEAVAVALEQSELEGRDVEAVFGPRAQGFGAEIGVPGFDASRVVGQAEASGAAFGAIEAFRWLRRREGRVALVIGPQGQCATAALVLMREG